MNSTKHSITTIYMYDTCNIMLQCSKSFQLQIFLFFLILQYPFLSYNYFHNILRLFDVLPNFPFTTSETMPDYYLQRWCIKVASRAAVKNLRVASRPKKERLKVSRSTLFHMKTRVSLKCFVTGCLWKPLNDASLLKSL